MMNTSTYEDDYLFDNAPIGDIESLARTMPRIVMRGSTIISGARPQFKAPRQIECPRCHNPLHPGTTTITFKHALSDRRSQSVDALTCECGEAYVRGDVAQQAFRRAMAGKTDGGHRTSDDSKQRACSTTRLIEHVQSIRRNLRSRRRLILAGIIADAVLLLSIYALAWTLASRDAWSTTGVVGILVVSLIAISVMWRLFSSSYRHLADDTLCVRGIATLEILDQRYDGLELTAERQLKFQGECTSVFDEVIDGLAHKKLSSKAPVDGISRGIDAGKTEPNKEIPTSS